MNAAQLQAVLRQAGWPEDLLVTMAAVALAESGGNPRSHNPVPPDDSYGLWQINMIGSLGPQRRAQFGISSNSALYDPLTNARAALAIFRSQGLRAWSTYSNGAYGRYKAQSQAAYSGGSGFDNFFGIPFDGGFDSPAAGNGEMSYLADPFGGGTPTGAGVGSGAVPVIIGLAIVGVLAWVASD